MNAKLIFNNKNRTYYIFLIILPILFLSIKSEESCDNLINDNECNTNCPNYKPSIVEKKCIDCSNQINSNSDDFFIIKEGVCQKCTNKENNGKVIYKTKECVSYCPSQTWELGDFCYFENEINSNSMKNYTKIPYQTLKCLDKYKKDIIKGFTQYTCLNNGGNCDTNYYDGETKECISESECNNNKYKYKKIEGSQTRCTSKCFKEEYTYEKEKQCLSKCDKFYYKRMDDSKFCVDICDDGDFFEEDSGRCVSGCNNNSIILYSSFGNDIIKTKQCVSYLNKTKYYYYNDMYFEDCNDTLNLLSKKTYKYEENNIKQCVEYCSYTNKTFSSENECVYKCSETRNYYYDKKCLSSCNEINRDRIYYTMNYSIINNNNNILTTPTVINKENKNITIVLNEFPKSYECLENCPIGTYIDIDSKQCFITSCFNDAFINSKFECIKSCDNGKGYIYEENVNIKILTQIVNENLEIGGDRRRMDGEVTVDESVDGTGIMYYEIVKRFCLSSCPNSAPYHHKNNNICYNTPCKERKNFSAYDNPYICYDNCNDIEGDKYNYESNFICYKTSVTCDLPYYYIGSDGLKQCASYNDCREKGYKYIREKECVFECDSKTYYSYADGNNLGECFLDPNDCIKKGYNYYNNSDKICQKDCDSFKISDFDSNLIKNEKGETCFESCPADYSYIDKENRLCFKNCPLYFYGKECLNDCKSINKYHFENSYECVDNCYKEGTKYYETENSIDKICYYSCPKEYSFKEYINQSEGYRCVKECTNENRFYYEDQKICRHLCDLYNSNEKNETKCVYECSPGQKKYDKYCINECPKEASYIEKIKSSDKIIETCTNSCPKLISNSTNYCLSECTIHESFEYEKKCYEKCPEDTYADDLTKKCSLTGCPSGLNYYLINNGVKECKLKCPSDKYASEKGGECSDYCPKEYNKIGGINLCISNCNYTYGEYYQEIKNESNLDYPIYKCVQMCDEDFLLVYDTKECINRTKCPEGYYKSPNNICYKTCDLDEDNPFTTKNDDNELVCAKKCHKDEPNYGNDKICKTSCSHLNEENSNITDYDGACVSKCNNPIYKYLQNWECVKECNTKYIIEKELKCVDICTPPYNYLEDNKCKEKCEHNPFEKEIFQNGIKVIECIEECDDNNKYHYENSKKCFPKCGDKEFIILDKNLCVTECPPNYFKYVYDGIENSTYLNNTCVLECPKDKPLYVPENKLCLRECSGINKNHNENENICIYQCSPGTINDNGICRRSCPIDKFFYDNKCLDTCPPTNQFYIPGINVCLKECDKTLYRTDGDKCVSSCNETSYYLESNNTCLNYCPSDHNYRIKYDELNKYIPNTCFNDCPEEYPYFNKKEPDTNFLHICQSDCNYKGNRISIISIECLDFCIGDEYKYYDSQNKQCNSSCPNGKPYYVQKEKNNYIYYECYNNCPKDFPFKNGSQCVNKCDFFGDFEKKECVNNCESYQKEFYDNDIKYCLNNCSFLGLFIDGDKCVMECNKTRNLISNMATKTCECDNLFYIENDQKFCLDSNIKSCATQNEYKIRKYKTNECVKDCRNGILSVNEDYCYSDENDCPINTSKNGTLEQCICSFKFYKNNNNKIICLDENEECPSSYTFLFPNKECKSDCNEEYNIKYDNKCLKGYNFIDFEGINNSGSIQIPTCTTPRYSIFNGENYTCTEEEISCGENYPYYIEYTKECVKECSNPKYFIYNELNGAKECVSSCDNTFSYIEKINISSSQSQEEYKYICSCKNKWYKEGNSITCAKNPETTCKELKDNLEYYIEKTNECLPNCQSRGLYKFNEKCFSSCDDAKYNYGYNVKNGDSNECICENLWIQYENGTIECISDDICKKEGYKYLVNSNMKCVGNCPSNTFEFNHICYESKKCPSNTTPEGNKCKCIKLHYEYKDEIYNENFIYCLSKEIEVCPIEDNPYLINNTGQCVKSPENCSDSSKIFNYICYNVCPDNTKLKTDSNECECNQENKWYQYIEHGRKFLKCNVEQCPTNKTKLDSNTNECKSICNDKQYHYDGNCYDNCPDNTRLIDEISKECIKILAFDKSNSLSDLEQTINDEITNIYPTTSKGGLVYNINNSTLQIYGVNRKKANNKDLIMRSNLTYIDLSYCIDKLYEKNRLSDDVDIIIVKYDIGDKTSSSTINPVEFKLVNSQTGEVIPLDACEDNSIVISYPISSILNNFIAESKNLRNLEEEENNKNLNLKEKFLKGKELYLENEEIDSFNFENKLYTDMCYSCEINGKDLILEDRFNYLYPLFSFCESNCIYNKTDFIMERVICNCSPKDGINFERTFELQNNNADIQKAKDNQKSSVLKCLTKISNISKNFGFYYGLIIILVVIGMVLLTILYSYKVLIMRIQKRFDIKEDNFDKYNDTDNIENSNLKEDKNYKNKKQTEEININIKTSERNLKNPPKKQNKYINTYNYKKDKNDKKDKKNKKEETKQVNKDNKENKHNKDSKHNKHNKEDPEIIKIKQLKMNKHKTEDSFEEKEQEDRISSNEENKYDEKSSYPSLKGMEDENIVDLIKMEKRLLTIDYNIAIKKNKAEIIIMVLTEILDKIYITKAIWLLQNYEVFSLYFSLYLLWHILILSFLSLFYNNNTIQKIWINDNYPDFNFHLGFGFVACLISFVFYKVLFFLINNDRKIKEISKENNKVMIEQQYNKMMFWIKLKIFIFYVVEFILLIIFFLYLISFCGVYGATTLKLVESYGIALIEIVIIKVIYGLLLGVLRKISLSFQISVLYSIVRFLDLYIS